LLNAPVLAPEPRPQDIPFANIDNLSSHATEDRWGINSFLGCIEKALFPKLIERV
jgi:hypothetical protein